VGKKECSGRRKKEKASLPPKAQREEWGKNTSQHLHLKARASTKRAALQSFLWENHGDGEKRVASLCEDVGKDEVSAKRKARHMKTGINSIGEGALRPLPGKKS